MKLHIRLMLTLMVALIVAIIPAIAQDTPPPPPDMEMMMQKMMEAGSPGQNHRVLDPFVGNWNTESSFWVEGPDNPPMANRGSASFAWVLGGRFLKMDYKGNFMGGEMVGIGYYGYDNMQKKHIQIWMDNTSTAFFPAVGALDEKNKTITLTGPADDPATGVMGKTMRYVIGIPENDRFVFEMHDMSLPGPNQKVGEIVYTRAPRHH